MKYFGTTEQLKSIIEGNTSWSIKENCGNVTIQIKTSSGMIFNFFSSTKSISIQGSQNEKDLEILKSLLEIKSTTSEFIDKKNNNVFIVHGSDELAKLEVKDILHDWGLTPFISGEQPSNGGSILSNLLEHINSCAYGIVLLTPDDTGYMTLNGEQTKRPRARQNVLIELGMLIQHFGVKNMVILRKSDTDIPTDILGLIHRPFDKSVREVKDQLHQDLKNAGILKN